MTTARHEITYRGWGQRPVADVDAIAEMQDCSRQAIRTALETAQGVPSTRYPRLSRRRSPTDDEVVRLRGLHMQCPQAPRNREGSRAVRSLEGRALAEACRALIDDGIPMATLTHALGRGATWMH